MGAFQASFQFFVLGTQLKELNGLGIAIVVRGSQGRRRPVLSGCRVMGAAAARGRRSRFGTVARHRTSKRAVALGTRLGTRQTARLMQYARFVLRRGGVVIVVSKPRGRPRVTRFSTGGGLFILFRQGFNRSGLERHGNEMDGERKS